MDENKKTLIKDKKTITDNKISIHLLNFLNNRFTDKIINDKNNKIKNSLVEE